MSTLVVTDLRVSNRTATSIELAWTPVDCFQRNGLPVDVRITLQEESSLIHFPLRSARSPGLMLTAITPDTGTYTFTGLVSGTTYSVQIHVVYNRMVARNDGASLTGASTVEGLKQNSSIKFDR